MTKQEFSAKILECSYNHWRYILRGERNLGYSKAKIVSQLFSTPVEIWIDGTMAAARQAAWESFNQRGQK
jgi:hypothetical protein